jgi:hypothetical protein
MVKTDIIVRTVGATHADLVAQVRAQLRTQSEAIHTSARRTGDPRPDPACIGACAHIRDINASIRFSISIYPQAKINHILFYSIIYRQLNVRPMLPVA